MRQELYVLCVFLLAYPVRAASYNAITSGGWDQPATWDQGSAPSHLDSVTIGSGNHVMITNDYAACTNWQINADGTCTIETGGGLTNLGPSTYYGTVTQNAGTVLMPNSPARPAQLFHNRDAGGYVINEGFLHIGYGPMVGGNKGNDMHGLLTINGGTIEMAVSNGNLSIGYGGTGKVVINDGAVTNFRASVLGKGQKDMLHANIGELIINGGRWHQKSALDMGSGGFDNFTFTTGVLTQAGGVFEMDSDLTLASYRTGRIDLRGGRMSIAGDIKMSSISNAVAELIVSGGSLEAVDVYNINTTLVEVVGGGCTNFTLSGDFLLNSNAILRAVVGNDGLSCIEAGGDVGLTNMTLQLDAVAGYNGNIGDTYEFIRTPEAFIIYTNGLTVSNVHEKFYFDIEIYNQASYDRLRVIMMGPPKATTIIVK